MYTVLGSTGGETFTC